MDDDEITESDLEDYLAQEAADELGGNPEDYYPEW